MISLELEPAHQGFWQHFKMQYAQQRMTHAYLLTAADYGCLERLALRMLATIFCGQAQAEACGHCQSCRMLAQGEHPDLLFVKSEKKPGTIKIDQIRTLQQKIYTAPYLASQRGILISPADRMNRAASNALLKILEEPPANTYFFLIAEQISTIGATIISRCQRWNVGLPEPDSGDFDRLSQSYAADSARGNILAQWQIFVQDLKAIRYLKISFNAVALKWSAYEFSDLIWFLYRLHAQMIVLSLCQKKPRTSDLEILSQDLGSVLLFRLLEQLQAMTKRLATHASISPLLWLEAFLLEYVHARTD